MIYVHTLVCISVAMIVTPVCVKVINLGYKVHYDR